MSPSIEPEQVVGVAVDFDDWLMRPHECPGGVPQILRSNGIQVASVQASCIAADLEDMARSVVDDELQAITAILRRNGLTVLDPKPDDDASPAGAEDTDTQSALW